MIWGSSPIRHPLPPAAHLYQVIGERGTFQAAEGTDGGRQDLVARINDL